MRVAWISGNRRTRPAQVFVVQRASLDAWAGPTVAQAVYQAFVPRNRANASGRAGIFRRDGYRCVYCDVVLPEEQLTIDHVEPRMRGGDRSTGNLVTACASCNTAKAGRPAWRFLADQPDLRENFMRNAVHVWPRLRRAIEEAARLNNREAPPKL